MMAMSRSIRRNGAHPTEKWDGPQDSHEQDSHEQAYHSILLVTVIVIVLRSRDGASAQEGRGASQRLRATWLHLRGIQCDERDAPQCFVCQPTSRNNSAREASTAGAQVREKLAQQMHLQLFHGWAWKKEHKGFQARMRKMSRGRHHHRSSAM